MGRNAALINASCPVKSGLAVFTFVGTGGGKKICQGELNDE